MFKTVQDFTCDYSSKMENIFFHDPELSRNSSFKN